MKTIIDSDYKNLKLAYVEVKTFIEKEVGTKVSSLQTTIEGDLGCAGYDNDELLVKFVTKYNLDHTQFDYSKHFLSEGELFNPFPALIYSPFAIAFWVIKVITNGKINLFKVNLFPYWPRLTLDLTFGDMVTWYLRGTYCLRTDVKFKLRGNK